MYPKLQFFCRPINIRYDLGCHLLGLEVIKGSKAYNVTPIDLNIAHIHSIHTLTFGVVERPLNA